METQYRTFQKSTYHPIQALVQALGALETASGRKKNLKISALILQKMSYFFSFDPKIGFLVSEESFMHNLAVFDEKLVHIEIFIKI